MKLPIDGQEAYVYTGGKPFDAALPCIVFIHGALNDHSVWTLLARWCAHHGYAVLAPDLPGHGRSAGLPLQSVEALAAWQLKLLAATGVAQATWVGHSMGSLIALEAAAQRPAQAARLVMVGTAYPMKVSDTLLATARERPEDAMAMVCSFSHGLASAKPSYPGPGSWLRGGSMALMRHLQARQTAANLFEQDFLVCDRYAGAEAATARVTCPVDLVLGKFDQMTPAKAVAPLQTAWPSARTHILPCGHNLMGEAPEQLLSVLRRLLPAPGTH
ncbi:MAG: alpha/beta hydrolase [Roseateles depolymerans]|uniref:Alpha/beta hydrolase n=1 Tax=Roseateles depolymerans TaxID=76731 RepID=A0A2W5DLF3_9BURK|nr:MAG: alpha/beta hydrolase [Roseateles depolymerans]